MPKIDLLGRPSFRVKRLNCEVCLAGPHGSHKKLPKQIEHTQCALQKLRKIEDENHRKPIGHLKLSPSWAVANCKLNEVERPAIVQLRGVSSKPIRPSSQPPHCLNDQSQREALPQASGWLTNRSASHVPDWKSGFHKPVFVFYIGLSQPGRVASPPNCPMHLTVTMSIYDSGSKSRWQNPSGGY